MKKYIFSILSIVAMCGLSACEDVPAPYELNETGTTDPTDSPVLFSEEFASTLGECSSIATNGDYNWVIDYSCAKISSYDSETKTDNAADSWLVTPQIDLTEVDSACVYFKYILRYANESELSTNYLLCISNDYDGDVTTATWQTLTFGATNGSDWNTWYECDYVDIPQSYMGGNVTIAIRYIAKSKAATWEVKNLAVYKGSHSKYSSSTATGGGNNDDEQALPYSETFEKSFGTFKSELVEGSGNWIIDYKTAKATGYNNKVNTAGVYMLISAPVNISKAAHITYDYILRYKDDDSYTKLVISEDYAGDASKATWKTLKANHTEGSDWSTFATADVNIPTKYVGKTIRIAYVFTCTDSNSATWEVKNFSVSAGSTGEDVVITEDLILNQDFTKGLGDWTEQTTPELTKISAVWTVDATHGAQAKAIKEKASEIESRLISPIIDLSTVNSALLLFTHKQSFFGSDDDIKNNISVQVSENGTDWTTLVISAYPSYNRDGQITSADATADLSAYVGKNIYIAFRFTSVDCTWFVKSVSIK